MSATKFDRQEKLIILEELSLEKECYLKYIDSTVGNHWCAQQQEKQTKSSCERSPYWP
jgi:hypothetical protein